MVTFATAKTSNTQSPDVSIIIPTYNRISMLEEALSSVFAQEFDGVVEIFVIDDNSQDGTSETVRQKYPQVNLISLKQNGGAYVTRNLALLEAKGKYIAFLDSDDLWESNYLKTQISALEGKENAFSVSALLFWNTTKNRKIIRTQKPDLVSYISPVHHLLVSSFIATPSSVVFARKIFDEIGLFDEQLRVGADVDFYLRCYLAGYNPIFIEHPLAILRKHGKEQLTDAKNLKLREKSRLIRMEKFFKLAAPAKTDLVFPSIQRVKAEIYANFSISYIKNKRFFYWLDSISAIAAQGFPILALSAANKGIQTLIYTRAQRVYSIFNNSFKSKLVYKNE